MSVRDNDSRVCIAGGGPAGMLLGYLLARAGVAVTVLEKHADFLRDFRGDTVHPSTLQILDQCGLLPQFSALPQQRVQQLSVSIAGRLQPVVDFRGLAPFDYLSLVPQWDFLNLLAESARPLPGFRLLMRHEVEGLARDAGRVRGVIVNTPGGQREFGAELVVACDGRGSTVRGELGLPVRDLGAPMDALWFRLPRDARERHATFGILGAGHILVLLNRGDYWQAAFVVPKGEDAALRARPVAQFRRTVARLAPFLEEALGAVGGWDDVATLVVRVDRLLKWHAPGVLLIGDAAHAMSPIGGVGINLAIQDAVAAANAIAGAIQRGEPLDEALCRGIQRRRERPTRLIQRLQLTAQRRVISAALARRGEPPRIPGWLRLALRFRRVRNVPARIIGYGFGRERVDTTLFVGT